MPDLHHKVSRFLFERQATPLHRDKITNRDPWCKRPSRRYIPVIYHAINRYSSSADMPGPNEAHKKPRKKTACELKSKSESIQGSPKKHISTTRKESGSRSCQESELPSATSKHAEPTSRESRLELHPSGRKEDLSANLTGPASLWATELRENLGIRKQEVIDRFMAAVAECLDRKLAPLEELCDGEGCSSSSQSSRKGGPADSCKPASKRQSIGRKRQFRRDEDDDDDEAGDNGDGGKRKDNNKRLKKASKPTKMFACPYLKHDPDRFGNQRPCMAPGWPDTSRLKEHLKRKHRLPEFHCPRCLEPFEEEEQLLKHQRADKVCQLKQAAHRDLCDGMDKTQWEQIKKKNQKPGHDKWQDWYRILFKLGPNSTNTPSPYQNDHSGSAWSEGHTNHSKHGAWADNFREYFQEQARTMIEAEVDKFMSGMQPQLQQTIANRLSSLSHSIHQVWQSDPALSGLGASSGNSIVVGEIPQSFDADNVFGRTNYLDTLNSITFGPNDGFPFTEPADPTAQGLAPVMDGSSQGSNVSEGFDGTNASSNTSLGVHSFHGKGAGSPLSTTAAPWLDDI